MSDGSHSALLGRRYRSHIQELGDEPKPDCPEIAPSRESEGEDIGSAGTLPSRRRPASSAKELGIGSRGTPGVSDDDMSIKNSQRKLGTTRRSPRRRSSARRAVDLRSPRLQPGEYVTDSPDPDGSSEALTAEKPSRHHHR